MAMHLRCGSLSSSSPLLSHARSSSYFSLPLFSSCFSAKSRDAYHQLTISTPSIKEGSRKNRKSSFPLIARSGSSTSSEGSQSDSKLDEDKVEFGYSRKDVLLIGLGVTLAGYGCLPDLSVPLDQVLTPGIACWYAKICCFLYYTVLSVFAFLGVDPLQAGNAVQLIIVLGLTIGWIASYMFRVANKDMTYAQQLRDYEKQVMEKRLESLTEADLEALLEQVEEEKTRLRKRREASP